MLGLQPKNVKSVQLLAVLILYSVGKEVKRKMNVRACRRVLSGSYCFN